MADTETQEAAEQREAEAPEYGPAELGGADVVGKLCRGGALRYGIESLGIVADKAGYIESRPHGLDAEDTWDMHVCLREAIVLAGILGVYCFNVLEEGDYYKAKPLAPPNHDTEAINFVAARLCGVLSAAETLVYA